MARSTMVTFSTVSTPSACKAATLQLGLQPFPETVGTMTDLRPVEARYEPTRVLCGDRGEVYVPTTSLIGVVAPAFPSPPSWS
jgi:hypothetical protein